MMKENKKRAKVVKSGFINIAIAIVLVSFCHAQGSVNLELEIPTEYREITSGGEIWFTNKILNLINQNRIDVTLTYQLLDSGNKIITERTETVAIETQASFVGSLEIPKNIQKGDYTLKTILTINESEYEANNTIKVIEEEKNLLLIYSVSILLGLLLLLLIIKKSKKIIEKIRLHNKIHRIVQKKLEK